MIGKIIGAAAGAAAGNKARGMTGLKGAIAGTLATAVLRRLGIPGLIAAGMGGYLLKKRAERIERSAPPLA